MTARKSLHSAQKRRLQRNVMDDFVHSLPAGVLSLTFELHNLSTPKTNLALHLLHNNGDKIVIVILVEVATVSKKRSLL